MDIKTKIIAYAFVLELIVVEVMLIIYPKEQQKFIDIYEVPQVVYSDLSIDGSNLIYDIDISQREVELIAKVTMAEAGSESDYMMRLVIDTILNRVDHDSFPDTIEDVIFQPSAFAPVETGWAWTFSVNEHIVDLIYQELYSRTNYECIAFRTDHYHNFGEPLFNVDNVYFSKY